MVYRMNEYVEAIKRKNLNNSMAKHLAIYHHDKQGNPDNFVYSSVATFKKCLEREVSEGLANPNPKSEAIVHRTTVTREVRHGS